MTTEERVKAIRKVVIMIREAKVLMDDAISGTKFKISYESYGRYGFNILLNYISNLYDEGLDSLIDDDDEQ